MKQSLSALDPLKAKAIIHASCHLRLPVRVKEELEKRAKSEKVSLNALMIHLCIDYLKKLGRS